MTRRKKLREPRQISEEDLTADIGADLVLPAEKVGNPVSELESPVKPQEVDGIAISELQAPFAELKGDES